MHFSSPLSDAKALSKTISSTEYGVIFNQRGLSYDQAMHAYPQARRQEFLQLFRLAPIVSSDVVLDIPSLGGYLGWYLSEPAAIVNLDFAESFRTDVRIVSPYGDWSLQQKVTRVICLASLHHVDNLMGFLRNLASQVDVGVRIHLADVGLGSKIARFLDEFVGRHTPTGHKGHYRDWNAVDFPETLACIDVATLPCPWSFTDPAAAAHFARMLFGVVGCSDNDILEAIETMVGMDHNADGGVSIHWHLSYVDLLRV